MNIFLICLNAVVPVFLIMAVGYIARHCGLLNEADVSKINKIAFKTFMPLMLFYDIYDSDLSTAFRPRLIIFAVVCVLVEYFLVVLFVKLSVKEKDKQSVMIQGMFRSNFVIIGMPIAGALMAGEDLSPVAVLIAIVVPLFNVLAVVTLEVFRGEKIKPGKIILDVLKNPLIIGSAVGLIFLVLKIKLPAPVDTAVGDMAGVASPLLLFLLGAFLSFGSIKKYLKKLIQVSAVRLIIVPGVFLTLAYFMGFKGVEFAALIGVFASATAVSSFTMAQQMGGHGELAGDIVVFTSVMCSFTLYMWCVIFMSLGVI